MNCVGQKSPVVVGCRHWSTRARGRGARGAVFCWLGMRRRKHVLVVEQGLQSLFKDTNPREPLPISGLRGTKSPVLVGCRHWSVRPRVRGAAVGVFFA